MAAQLMSMTLFEQLKEHLVQHHLCALATVVEAPAGVGRKLLVLDDGSAQGDIDDALRAETISRAQALMRSASSETVPIAGARVFIEVFGPPPTLVIFGAVHTAAPLSLYAHTLGFRVV